RARVRQLSRLARQPRGEPGALQARPPGASGAAPPAAGARPARLRAAPARRPALKVAVLTTSYPRYPGDAAGHFVGEAVERLRGPYVVQVWGTDIELARRTPWLARAILRRARRVVAASTWLADSARELGATEVDVIPSGVELPDEVGPPADPPEVLYAGRLSP